MIMLKGKTGENSQHETFCMLLVIDNVFNKQLKILPFVSATQTKHIKRNERNPIMIIKSVTRQIFISKFFQNINMRDENSFIADHELYRAHALIHKFLTSDWLFVLSSYAFHI